MLKNASSSKYQIAEAFSNGLSFYLLLLSFYLNVLLLFVTYPSTWTDISIREKLLKCKVDKPQNIKPEQKMKTNTFEKIVQKSVISLLQNN